MYICTTNVDIDGLKAFKILFRNIMDEVSPSISCHRFCMSLATSSKTHEC